MSDRKVEAAVASQLTLRAQLVLAGAEVWRDEDINAYKREAYEAQPHGLLYRLFKEDRTKAMFSVSGFLAGASALLTAMLRLHFACESVYAPAIIIGLMAFIGAAAYQLRGKYHYGPHEWNSNVVRLPTGQYMRNYKPHYISQQALALIQRLAKAVPGTYFSVEFLGNDPILWGWRLSGGIGTLDQPCKMEKVAIRVWDEVNGIEFVVPSP